MYTQYAATPPRLPTHNVTRLVGGDCAHSQSPTIKLEYRQAGESHDGINHLCNSDS
jgi:hypothetical protein